MSYIAAMWRGLAALLVVLSVGCPANNTDWFVEFESPALAERAEFTRLAAYRVGESVPCPPRDRDDPVFAPVLIGPDSVSIPELGSGVYCFVAVGSDASCRTVAEGHVEVELPTSDPIVVVAVEAVTECGGSCGSAGRCLSGRCGSGRGYCEVENVCCPGEDEDACNVYSVSPGFCDDFEESE